MLKGLGQKVGGASGAGAKPHKKPKGNPPKGTKQKVKKKKPKAVSFFNYNSPAHKKTKIYNPETKKKINLYLKKGSLNPKASSVIAKYPEQAEVPDGFVFNKIDKRLVRMYNKAGTKLNPNVGVALNKNSKSLQPPPNFVINLATGRLVHLDSIMNADGTFKNPYKDGYTLSPDGYFFKNPATQGEPLFVKNKYKNHGILVYNVFNYEDDEIPTTIEGFIDNIKNMFETQFTMLDKQRDNRQVLLRFGEDKGSQEYRYFPYDDIDNLPELIANWGKKDAYGSEWDAFNELISEDNLDKSWFRINIQGLPTAGAKGFVSANSTYWVCEQIATANNQCIEGAIKRHLGWKVKTEHMRGIINTMEKNVFMNSPVDLQYLHLYEQVFKVNIDVYADKPHYEDNCILKSEGEFPENTMRVLYKDQHFYLIKKEKLQISKLTTKQQHELGIFTQSNRSCLSEMDTKMKQSLKEVLVIFDNETIFDRFDDNYLKVYGISWVVWDIDKEFNYDEQIHLDEPICYYRSGHDCLKEFIKFIINPPEGVIYRPVGFNNSRFDNFSVAEMAKEMGVFENIFMADGTILSFTLQGTKPFWDASRFLVGSLASCCKNFNTKPKKAPDLIDHYEVQCYYEKNGMDGLQQLLKERPQLIMYNKLDCLCLLSLVQKLYYAYRDLFGANLFGNMTISSMAYKLLTEKWSGKEEYKDKLAKMDIPIAEMAKKLKEFKPKYNIVKPRCYEDDLFFRQSLTAGRTQAFYGKLRFEFPCAMADYKSLYPFVMGNYVETSYSIKNNIKRPRGKECPYPYGSYRKVDCFVPDKLGIYRVDINHQRTKWADEEKVYEAFKKVKRETGHDLYRKYAPNVIAHRVKDKPLDWDYKGKIKNIKLTSIDIQVIQDATGDPNCITIYEGYVWDDKRTDLFNLFLDKPKDEKTRQDKLKKENPSEYNDAIREVAKLIQNSVSGKLLEALHEDTSKPFTLANYIKMCRDEKVSKVEINDYGGGLSFITGKKDVKACFEAMSYSKIKPSYLGMFVYSYARRWIYEGILRRYITLYMDTDSACMPYFEWERCIAENKDDNIIDTGEYGCLEEEVCATDENGDDVPANLVITISPKNYLVENKFNEKCSKRKMKGVRKTDKWLPLSYFGEWDIIKDKTGRNIVNPKCEAKQKIYSMTQNDIRRMRESNCCVKCIDKVIDNKEMKCETCRYWDNLLRKCYTTEMFEELVKGQKIAVFCSMINRIRYKKINNGEWEFKDNVEYNASIEDLVKIMSSNDVKKKGICMTLGVSNKLDLLKKYDEFVSSVEGNSKYYKKDGSFNKSKAEQDFYKNNIKYDKIEKEEDLELLFKLRQTFMIKTI